MTEKQSSSIPKISVIMSVRNGEHDLEKSMSSLFNQTFTEWELIVCDDGSTDNTLEKLKRYALKDSRVVILHNDTSKGLAYSLNRCIESAKSNILARQDADDASDVHRFEIQYPFVMAHPEYAVVGTCWYNVDADGKISESVVPELPTAMDMVKGGLYLHPSWMMRKDRIEKVGFYTVNQYTVRSQDYHFIMKILAAGMILYNMPEKLYYYTVDQNTLGRSRNWKRVKGLMWIRWDSYRRNHLPIRTYIYVLKPLISNLIPKTIMNDHYKRVYGQK